VRLRRVLLALSAPAVVRAAVLGDLARIVEIDAEAFGDLPYPSFFLRQAIDTFGGLLRVVEHHAGEVAGYALGAMTAGEKAGWILSMAVHSDRRGSGLGEVLLADMEATLAERGAEEVLLTVEPANATALALYGRHGFTLVRDEPDYFGPGERRLVLGRRLSVVG
jgi:ribosomal protein S18 acetylase RimI-like enzyme